MSDSSELSLLQARLQSLERDLAIAQRRLTSKEEELATVKADHAKEKRSWEEKEAVLEGQLLIATQDLAKLQQGSGGAGTGNGRKPPPLPLSHVPPAVPSSLSHPPAQPLPLRPLIPYSDDSPFFRREENVFATKVNNLSSRLKKIVAKAKEFSQSISHFSQTASSLAQEMSAPWGDVEGGLDAILANNVQNQVAQMNAEASPSPTPPSASASPSASSSSYSSSEAPAPGGSAHRAHRSSIIQSEELVSLSSAFGKLGAMLSTVSDIGSNLSVNVDAFLVSALMDFRSKHIQNVLDKEQLLKKSMEEFEAALVKRLNKKREKSLFGTIGIVTDKMKKKQQQEDEEIRNQILICSMLKKNYELLRFDYCTLLNEVLLERRMELIEMICASFLGFITFFHEGNYIADTLRTQVDTISKSINQKRPLYVKSGEGIREQRIAVERALDLASVGATSSSSTLGTGTTGPGITSSNSGGFLSSNANMERVLKWRVFDSFPTSTTASGLLSAEATTQVENRTVLLTPAVSSTGGAPVPVIPSPYAHALIRGKLVPIEKEGYLRKQSSSLKKDWKKRWFILQAGNLFYVRNETDLNPIHVQAVLLCTVRISQKSDLDLCFDLISPNKRVYTLQACSEEERKEWMEVFQNTSEALLNASGNTLTAEEAALNKDELRSLQDAKSNAVQQLRVLNPYCVDCNAKDPDWASINLGILICIACSGIHRSMGVHISKVRSISLDSWTTELLDLMLAIGNTKFNALYEGSLQTDEYADAQGSDGDGPSSSSALHTPKPTPDSNRESREDFIVLKYQRKAFLNKKVLSQAALDPKQHVKSFLHAAEINDIEQMMNWLSLGVKVDDYLKSSPSLPPAAGQPGGPPPIPPYPGSPSPPAVSSATAAAASTAISAAPSSSTDELTAVSSSPSPSPVSASSSSSSSALDAVHATRALHLAARHDNILALELLLQNNARETLLDDDGKTALQIATERNSVKCQTRLSKRS